VHRQGSLAYSDSAIDGRDDHGGGPLVGVAVMVLGEEDLVEVGQVLGASHERRHVGG